MLRAEPTRSLALGVVSGTMAAGKGGVGANVRIFGIPLTVEISFFFVAILLGWRYLNEPALLAQWVAIVFVSVIIHELGHALAGRAFGLEPEIRLHTMGGLTSWIAPREFGPGRHVLVSLAGPFAGFTVGAVILGLFLALPDPSRERYSTLVNQILWVNVGWGLLNLLPILPLDGGNVVRSGLEYLTGRPARRAAEMVSAVLAAVLGVTALLYGEIWGAFLAGWFAVANATSLFEARRERGEEPLRAELDAAWHAIEESDGRTAVRVADSVFARARSNGVRRSASEALVYGNLLAGDGDAARRALGRYTALFGSNPYLEGVVATHTGDSARGASLLEALFDETPRGQVGRELARALARNGHFDRALALAADPRAESFRATMLNVVAEEAYLSGAFAESGLAASKAFIETEDPRAAYNAACAFARAGRDEEAITWLEHAASAGFADADLLDRDDDLAPLRDRDDFQRVVAHVRR